MTSVRTSRWDYLRTGYLLAVFACAILVSVALAKLHNQDKAIKRQTAEQARQATVNHRAVVGLCALAKNIEKAAASEATELRRSKAFFKKHPNAFADEGVTPALVKQGQDAQQATIDRQHETAHVLRKALAGACK